MLSDDRKIIGEFVTIGIRFVLLRGRCFIVTLYPVPGIVSAEDRNAIAAGGNGDFD